jgi:hypothetical protein
MMGIVVAAGTTAMADILSPSTGMNSDFAIQD